MLVKMHFILFLCSEFFYSPTRTFLIPIFLPLVPSCNSPTVPKLSYTTAARGSQNKYLDGEKVYYSCHSGYELVGIPVVECQNGVWTYPSFTCLRKINILRKINSKESCSISDLVSFLNL